MFFCEKCRYLFNVTKDVKSKQIGGKINEALTIVFDKYANGEKITEKDLKKLKGKDILEDQRFEDMNKKDQRKLISTIKAIDKNFFMEEEPESEEKIGSNIAFFICKFCKNYKPIKPGTIIYSKNYNSSNISEAYDYSYAIYDQTLAHTKNYICKNSKCETHKNINLKEAVLVKNATDQLVYICTQCSTNWINGA